ncbi:unnamed protein product [Trifolium pratense]|uniref:Uncharacterized protein n=1 Tax=Trifolium pratense TaxID=57577 RepID=A0ACB0MES3_TRIPR|nr:unnamed protein product [Trifolium pratense]
MASGSGVGKFLPYAGKWTAATLSSYDTDVVPEPSLRLDLQKFWENQLIFPYSVDNLVHAFGGPKPSDKSRNSKVLSIFPVYKPCVPRVFISEPYNFSYIKAPNRVFRSAPSLNDQYLGWLDRVQRDKADIWQACGIYDLIQLSRTGLKYQQEMIIAALHFFESSTNTFHFECGMMTPTLLDVAAITGLSPLGDTYDPCKASDTIKFDFRNKSYSKYIVENRKTSDEPQNSAQVIPQDEPALSKAAEGVVEGPSDAHPEDVAEKISSPQPLETTIPTETSSPPKAPSSPPRAFEDDNLKPNNEGDQLDRNLPQPNPSTHPAQVLANNDPSTTFQADPVANTEQRPTVDGEHSTTNQPQPNGSNHESSSPSAGTFDSEDGNSYIGDSLGEEGTSVSKPLPTVVLPAELAKELKDLTSVDALNKLLSSHGTSSSAVEDTEGNGDVLEQEQFEHEIRFRREILNGDMLGLLERDSSIYYNIKALFRKLQNPRTDEAMFLLVTQAETFLEQFVSQSQLLTRTSGLLTSLLATQQQHFEQANSCNAEVTTIKAASDEALEQLVACENNIAQWQSEIEALKEKVRQEEAKMEKLAAVAIEAQKVKLDELAREGIQHYSEGLAVQKRVEHLASDKEMLQRKLASIRTLYYQFQAANRKPPSTSQQQS